MSVVVDVVIRTKDRPLFLQRALADIVAQTWQSWFVYLVNDGGDPAVVDATVRSSGVGERIKVIHQDVSVGMEAAANIAVRSGQGELIVLHDDDDTWAPEFLERAVDYLERHAEAPGVVSRIEIVWEQVKDHEIVETGREPFQPQAVAPLLTDTLLFNRFVPIGFVYRRRILDEVGGYAEDLEVVGDWDFNLRVLRRWPMEFLGPQPLAFWHQRPSDDGPTGNSVIAKRELHRRLDAMRRDEHLRRHVAEHGMGDLLYLTKFIDNRFWDIEHHVNRRTDAFDELRIELERLHERLDHLESEIVGRTQVVADLVHVNRPGLLTRAVLRRTGLERFLRR